MLEKRAVNQDIRPLKILIFNLMLEKQECELDLYRLLSNIPLQIETTLLKSKVHNLKKELPYIIENIGKSI